MPLTKLVIAVPPAVYIILSPVEKPWFEAVSVVPEEKELVSIVFEPGCVNEVICISSPSIFSKIKLFLSVDKCAETPVKPLKLFTEVARFVRSVVVTEALIEALLLVPALLLRVNAIVPSDDGAGIFNLVTADALIPAFDINLIRPQFHKSRNA